MHTKIFLISTLFFTTLLGGCFFSSEKTAVEFDWFTMTIDGALQEVAPWLIDNKQVANKILKSYKFNKNDSYDPNVLIAQTKVTGNINAAQLFDINQKKLHDSVSGIKFNSTSNVTFDCKGAQLDVNGVEFSMPKSILSGDTNTVQWAQYYILQWWELYIISTTSVNASDISTIKDAISTLSCK